MPLLGDESESEEGPEYVADSVEILGYQHDSEAKENIFDVLPPLSFGRVGACIAVAIEENESELGQVPFIGGWTHGVGELTAVHKVDLATGTCTPQSPLLSQLGSLARCSAARLADGHIVCVGYVGGNAVGDGLDGAAQVLEPPEDGSPSGASWQWRYLPAMSVSRCSGGGCVLSDGRFAVLGGTDGNTSDTRSCEALTMDGDGERWEQLPPMHEPRFGCLCAAIGGCVIVAGGDGYSSEVYEEALGRWRRLPCNLPHDTELFWMGSALM
jgi:hypothetical protein